MCVAVGAVLRVQVQETVRVAPEAFLDLVMDIERYAQVDEKISPVLWQRRDGDVGLPVAHAEKPTVSSVSPGQGRG